MGRARGIIVVMISEWACNPS